MLRDNHLSGCCVINTWLDVHDKHWTGYLWQTPDWIFMTNTRLDIYDKHLTDIHNKHLPGYSMANTWLDIHDKRQTGYSIIFMTNTWLDVAWQTPWPWMLHDKLKQLTGCRVTPDWISSWYNRHGWLGVQNELSIPTGYSWHSPDWMFQVFHREILRR